MIYPRGEDWQLLEFPPWNESYEVQRKKARMIRAEEQLQYYNLVARDSLYRKQLTELTKGLYNYQAMEATKKQLFASFATQENKLRSIKCC